MPLELAPDGYKHMLYRAKDGSEEEWIWNSRNGVTPFGVFSRDESKMLYHVEWQRDRFVPHYVPEVGERIFVDMTEEKARSIAALRVDAWDAGECPMRDHFSSKAEAIQVLVDDMTDDHGCLEIWGCGAPTILVVTPEIRVQLKSTSGERSRFAQTLVRPRKSG